MTDLASRWTVKTVNGEHRRVVHQGDFDTMTDGEVCDLLDEYERRLAAAEARAQGAEGILQRCALELDAIDSHLPDPQEARDLCTEAADHLRLTRARTHLPAPQGGAEEGADDSAR